MSERRQDPRQERPQPTPEQLAYLLERQAIAVAMVGARLKYAASMRLGDDAPMPWPGAVRGVN